MRTRKEFVIGIDAGTGSVRAGIFDLNGAMRGYGVAPINTWHPRPDFVEQSSENIWQSAGQAIRAAVKNAGLKEEDIKGISFDATCSLVTLDSNNKPITVSPTGRHEQNIIVWMDHRAKTETDFINNTGHPVLKYVGNKMSPEQEPPKLLWLKKNLKNTWRKVGIFLDLADYLTYRASGADIRSLCTVVCKWGYLGHKGQHGNWDKSFYSQIGMPELLTQNKIGNTIRPMGTPMGNLTKRSALELGLSPETVVGLGIIDAHAGGIGVAGIPLARRRDLRLDNILSMIAGTSTCHMVVSKNPIFVRGIWGPYFGAMIPGMWLTEGGQSATGSLIDFILQTNSLYNETNLQAKKHNLSLVEYLNRHLDTLLAKGKYLTGELNILPYFHGNRSPRANPNARGCISGLTLNNNLDAYAALYLAAIQSIAYGTRHIIEEMNHHGHRVKAIAACGGLSKNRYVLQEHANIIGCEIYLPKEEEAVLLGTAILAACALGRFASIQDAIMKMSAVKTVIKPNKSYALYHQKKYQVFKQMYRNQLAYNKLTDIENYAPGRHG
ncbi:MAG TPA: FGGY-family carbohydrate kinase [Planctomycetota bacterium]|nr:FGGY-family carbohydrate kinase [Planctomycetota bacterium]